MEIFHSPVLLEETLHLLDPQAGDLGVDGTTGEGGHSLALLQRFPGIRLLCLDADPVIQDKARQRLSPFSNRVTFVRTWFDQFFENYDQEKAPDFILLDLGISMFHYEGSGRGFSFRTDEVLDMRLSEETGPGAAEVVNTWDEEDLANLIFKYGEEPMSRRIARVIVERRKQREIQTAKELADIVESAFPPKLRHGRTHAATRTFQALRIAVNRELDRLERVLEFGFNALAVGGRMGVITFHSLEDRMVKTFFRRQAEICICPKEQIRCTCARQGAAKDLTRKPISAGEGEVAANSASRSAKLRGVQKLGPSRGWK